MTRPRNVRNGWKADVRCHGVYLMAGYRTDPDDNNEVTGDLGQGNRKAARAYGCLFVTLLGLAIVLGLYALLLLIFWRFPSGFSWFP